MTTSPTSPTTASLSDSSAALSCPPRFGTPRHPHRPTLGGRVAQVATKLRRPFMPWQQHVADVALEVDPATRLLVYREIVLLVPRQDGKTTLELAVAVHRATAWPRQQIVYTAQTRNDAREKWEEHADTVQASAYRSMCSVRRANGSEAIRWRRSGSRHRIGAGTEKSGHGPTLDLAFVDEAFSQVDGRQELALRPAMVTRPQPQLWVVSTAGTTRSTYLRRKLDTGRERELARSLAAAPPTGAVAYFEWSAPDDADPDDPATWWACMPALGHTITEETIRGEREAMTDDAFRRSYLNQWRDGQAITQVIPAADWAACADPAAVPGGRLVMALDVEPHRRAAAVSVAGADEPGHPVLEVIAHEPGTDWVAGYVADRAARHGAVAVVLDPAGPAGSLLSDLTAAKVAVVTTTARDMAAACGQLFDAAKQHDLRHRDQAPLNTALEGAATRVLGDAWAWDRRDSGTDICPLVACTLALWAHAKFVRAVPPLDVLDTIW